MATFARPVQVRQRPATPYTAAVDNSLADDVAAVGRIDAVRTILEVVCRTTGLGFAAVARVTEDRWIACAVRDEISFGLEPGGELQVATTLCDEVRERGQVIVIDHAATDEVYCGHPTPKLYGFQSYISMPIQLPDGQFFGTLCALDPKPARVRTPEIVGMFELFASLIAFHLDAQQRIAASERALLDERETAELREQFIAVMGHDLRSPLAAIDAGTQVLRKMPMAESAGSMLAIIQRSSARMRALIDNVMDFARGRLGGGLPVSRQLDAALSATLEHVIDELRTAWPDRRIESRIELSQPVPCDSARIGQLLSNLLANALTHGDPTGPVRVLATSDAERFELSVSNTGAPIAPELMSRLFHPFSRSAHGGDQQGLGLGLYIASEIARAHGGAIEVASTGAETRFTFRMSMRA
jgi:signal transduction histidine kinase